MVQKSYDVTPPNDNSKSWCDIFCCLSHLRLSHVLALIMASSIISIGWLIFNVYAHRKSASFLVQPEQIKLSLGANRQQIVVTWTTFNKTSKSTVWYGIDEINLVAHGSATLFTDGGPAKRSMYIHRVYLSHLQPNTTYRYHVGSKEARSGMFSFRTFPKYAKLDDWAPMLAVFGDMSVKDGRIVKRLAKEVRAGMYDSIFHVGDFAYDMHFDDGKVGDEFMRLIEPIAAYVPYQVCPGNHEWAYNFSNYDNRFTMHSEGDPQVNNHYWSYNYGPAHIVSFSTEFHFFTQFGTHQISNQYQWLEQDLKRANKPENRAKHPWIITIGHRPPYCQFGKGPHNEQEIIRLAFEQLFYKHGVDLQFWGHIHNYERIWPIYDNQVLNGSAAHPYTNPGGPVHIVTGAAGTRGMTATLKKRPKYSAFISSDYGYTKLKIFNSTYLHLQQISENLNGQVIDEFYLIKDNHGPPEV